jgi:hypothetical protein
MIFGKVGLSIGGKTRRGGVGALRGGDRRGGVRLRGGGLRRDGGGDR